MIGYGINPVREALRSGRVTRVWMARRANVRVQELARLAARRGLHVEWVDTAQLDALAQGAAHQGVIAEFSTARAYSVADLVAGAPGAPLLVVLDGVEDPQNLGAILRTAEAAGVDGVVRQTRHAAALGAAAVKTSAGAVAHLHLASVVNVARALEELKEAGLWVVGLAGEAAEPYDALDYTLPTALVLGSEGTGLRRLVRERCDRVVAIPMQGRVDSLNVAVAAAVVLFEALRQRRATRPRP